MTSLTRKLTKRLRDLIVPSPQVHRVPRGRRLQVENVEDRLMLSSVSLVLDSSFNAASNPGTLGGVAVADFNEDGVMDLASTADGAVSVHLGNGDGTYAARVSYPSPTGTAVTTADFDLDGNIDVLHPDYSGGIRVLLGNGDGTLQASTAYSGGSGPIQVAVGDYDANGYPDVAAANQLSGNVSIHLNDGTGGFLAPVFHSIGGTPVGMVSGDFDNDNDLDLASVNLDGNTFTVLLNQGGGTFAVGSSFSGNGRPFQGSAGDFNRDGNLDVVLANRTSQTITVHSGNGDGTFQDPTTYFLGLQPHVPEVADFNADGILDIAVSTHDDQFTGAVVILTGQSDGTFVISDTVNGIGGAFFSSTGDLDNDGRLDLAVTGSGAGLISILLNTSFAPTANAGGPYIVPSGSSVTLDASGSTDPDGNIMTYEWDFDYDGVTFDVDATGVSPTFDAVSLLAAETRQIGLRVTDSSGLSDIATETVTIRNAAPIITTPTSVSAVEGTNVDIVGVAIGDVDVAAPLQFSAPIGGTLNDQSGQGTGFKTRLPGTGTALAANDPNLQLDASNGKLLFTSTEADINGSKNLSILEAPGFLMPGIGIQDFEISAEFEDVSFPNLSDQLELYVGTSATGVVRAGFHEGNIYVFTTNFGAGDQNWVTGANAFSAGDDIRLSLSRTDSNWVLSWINHTNPSLSGSSPQFPVPQLDGVQDLYAGILASNARSPIPFTSTVDSFAVSGGHASPLQMTIAAQDGGLTLSTTNGLSFVSGDGTDDATMTISGTLSNLNAALAGLSYTANANFSGTDTITITVDDQGNLNQINPQSSVATIDVEVSPLPRFNVPHSSFDVGNTPYVVDSADVNRDGLPDLITSNYDSHSITVLHGEGDGTFGDSQTYTMGSGPIGMVVEDFNGDGLADVVVAGFNDGVLTARYGLPGGGLGPEVYVGAAGGQLQLTTTDIDGDGNLDIAGAHAHGQVSVWKNDGTGFFGGLHWWATTGNLANDVVAGDVDNDGDDDLIVARWNGTALMNVYLNDGTGSYAISSTIDNGWHAGKLAFEDLDNDGRQDLIATNATASSVHVYLRNGVATFDPPVAYATGYQQGSRPGAADFTGDGIADLVIANWASGVGAGNGSLSILAGKGDGTFWPAIEFATGDDLDGLAIADWNGDGALDVATTSRQASGSVNVHTNSSIYAAAPARPRVTIVGNAVTGSSTDFTVDMIDPTGAVVTDFVGTVTFASSDGLATLPSSIVFSENDLGIKSSTVVFNSSGTQSFTGLLTDSTTFGTIEVLVQSPPIAVAGGPYVVASGSSITLDGSGSTDPDGNIMTYEWDFDYDGVTFDVDETGVATTFDAASLTLAETRSLALRVTDSGGLQSVATTDLDIRGLVSHWVGDGTAQDVIGDSDGSTLGNATFSPGRIGQAFDFDASSGTRVEIPADPRLHAQSFTIETWVFARGLGSSTDRIGNILVGKDVAPNFISYDITGPGANGEFFFNVGFTDRTTAGFFSNDSFAFNTWHHLAMTWDGTTVRGYVNGVLQGSADGANKTVEYDSTPIAFGSHSAVFGGRRSNALVDDVKFYNLPKSASQIDDAYNSVDVAPTADAGGPYLASEGEAIVLDGAGSSDLNNDISTYEWDLDYDGVIFDVDAAGASPLFDATNLDGPDTRTIALRVTDESGLTDFVTTTVTIENVDPTIISLATANAANDVKRDLRHWYTGDADAADVYGGLNGSLVGGALAGVAGQAGGAFQLDGINDFVEIPFSATAMPGTGSFTAEIWINTTDDNTTLFEQYECGGSCPSGSNSLWGVAVSNGTAEATIRASDLSSQAVSGTTRINDGQFHHLVFVRDVENARFDLYIDGVLEGSSTLTVFSSITDDDGFSDPITIGHHRPPSVNPGDGRYTSGLFDEARIYQGALSPSDVAARFVGADVVAIGGAVTGFSALASDPAGAADPLTYTWDFGDGSDPVSGIDLTSPSHTFSGEGAFTVTLTVQDDDGGSTQQSLKVFVANETPTADAGGPYVVDRGNSLILDASGSTDPNGDSLSYVWDLDYDGVTFDVDASGEVPIIDTGSMQPGNYIVAVRVVDPSGAMDIDTANLEVLASAQRITFDQSGFVSLTDPLLQELQQYLDGSIAELSTELLALVNSVESSDVPAVELVVDNAVWDVTEGVMRLSDTSHIIVDPLGNSSNGSLTGTAQTDFIFGLGGADVISPGAGLDFVFGGTGNDRIEVYGSEILDDVLIGGGNFDQLISLDGSQDLVIKEFDSSTNGIERIDAAGGAIVGTADSNLFHFVSTELRNVSGVSTLSGDDTIHASNITHDVTYDAGDGNDSLFGGSRRDVLIGGTGNDNLQGGSNSDILNPGAGSDTVDGGTGNDRIEVYGSEILDDVLIGGGNFDQLISLDGSQDLVIREFDSSTNGIERIDAAGAAIVGTADSNLFHFVSTELRNVSGVSTLSGDDTIHASNITHDVIYDAGDGNDTLFGGSRRDVLIGGTGNDNLQGGSNSDILNPGAGSDTVDGGTGNDRIEVYGSEILDDVLIGGGNFDQLISLDGSQDLVIREFDSSTNGIERIDAAGAAIVGTADSNLFHFVSTELRNVSGVSTLSGDDTIHASNITHDVIYDAGDGNDSLFGGSRRDVLIGGNGNDNLQGGSNSDLLIPGAGSDTVDGGTGNDRIEVYGSEILDDVLVGGDNFDQLISLDGSQDLVIREFDSSTNGIERIDAAGGAIVGTADSNLFHFVSTELRNVSGVSTLSGDDTIHASNITHDVTYDAGDGNDSLFGGSRRDVLIGGSGNDNLQGGSNSDLLVPGAGSDTADGGIGNDRIEVYGSEILDDVLVGGDNFDQLISLDGTLDLVIKEFDSSTNGIERIDAAGGAIVGTTDSNLFHFISTELRNVSGVSTLSGDDTIHASNITHDVTYDAGDGNDSLFGGSRRDVLIGGNGNDILFGGGNSDRLVIVAGVGVDDVVDFNAAQGDRIDLTFAGFPGWAEFLNQTDQSQVDADGDGAVDDISIDLGAGLEIRFLDRLFDDLDEDWFLL